MIFGKSKNKYSLSEAFDMMSDEETDKLVKDCIADEDGSEISSENIEALVHEKISAKKKSEKLRSRIIKICSAAAAAAVCAVFAIAVLPKSNAVLYEGADKSAPYVAGTGEKYTVMSGKAFISDRKAENVSGDFKKAYADFALELLLKCRADGDKNTVISPASVMTVLAMSENGADGNTLAQFKELFGGKMGQSELNKQMFNFLSALESQDGAVMKCENSAWVSSSPSISVNTDFLEIIGNTYDAQISGVDFTDSENTADMMNKWCYDNTDGMIEKIVTPDMLTENTVLALMNAVIFDGKWEKPYRTFNVGYGRYTESDGTVKTVTMLNGEHDEYIEGDNELGFMQYYKGGKYAFAALLPNDRCDISEYISSLSGEYLVKLLSNMKNGKAKTEIPCFDIEFGGSIKDILSDMGISDAFDGRKADFSGIASCEHGNIYISDVIHKARIEFGSEGTRAAAASVVEMPLYTALEETNVKSIVFNRPFVYMIVDTESMLPVFIGACEHVDM